MRLAGFPAASLQFEDARFPYFPISSIFDLFKMSFFCYFTYGVTIIKKMFKIFLVLLIASQPLHSYTKIGIETADDNNGFQYLHTELCGSKYSDAISHTQKISKLLDHINTAVLSDMKTDCVCCESLDITKLDLILHNTNFKFIDNIKLSIDSTFYTSTVITLIPYSNPVRAPPIV